MEQREKSSKVNRKRGASWIKGELQSNYIFLSFTLIALE